MSEELKRVSNYVDARTGMQNLDENVVISVFNKTGHHELMLSDLRAVISEVAALRVKLAACEKDAARFNVLLDNRNFGFDEHEIVQLIATRDQFGNHRSDEYIRTMLDHLIQQSKDSAQGEK